jgi:outer membrane protein assembly factor BamD
MKRILLFSIIVVLLAACGATYNKALKSKDNEYKYKMAEKYYATKKWDKAQTLYDQLFPFYRGTPRFEDMYYKFCYCAYNQRDYMNAENLFKTYVENFPQGPRAVEAEYMRAYCYYKQSPKVDLDQTPTTKAMGLMQTFINTHPTHPKAKEAAEIIDVCRGKLEAKEFRAAALYYNLGFYKAAAIAYASVIEAFPDSEKGDEYKLQAIRCYYKYAENSITEKQIERFEKVLSESLDFAERYPNSKFAADVAKFKQLATTNIQNIKNNNEQATSSTQR